MTESGEIHAYEDITSSYIGSEEYDNFIQIIGCIEEIIVDEKFMDLQNKFLEEYWQEFDNEEENKLIYTDIFKKYILTIEKYIEERLLASVKGFDMRNFEKELEQKQNELNEEIFEMLSTFSDFQAFKNMFLDYKAMKEGRIMDFSQDISISKYQVNV